MFTPDTHMPCNIKQYDHDRILSAVLESQQNASKSLHMDNNKLALVKRRNVGIPKFLRSLRNILDNKQHDNVLAWSDDGKTIEIRNMDVLVKEILPKYFKHSKYASFQRQLNYFGFRKISRTKTTLPTFRQPYFTRNQPENILMMKRITGKEMLEAENRLRKQNASQYMKKSAYHPTSGYIKNEFSDAMHMPQPSSIGLEWEVPDFTNQLVCSYSGDGSFKFDNFPSTSTKCNSLSDMHCETPITNTSLHNDGDSDAWWIDYLFQTEVFKA